MLCRLTKPNLPGCVLAPATSTPFGSKSALNCSSVGRRRLAAPSCPTVAELDEGVDRDRRAVGSNDQRIDVDRDDVGASRRQRRKTQQHRRSVAHDRRRIRHETPPSSFWVDRPSIMSSASIALIGAGRNCTSAIASAMTPPTPSMMLAPNCGITHHAGDQLAAAGDHRRDQQRHVAIARRLPEQQFGGGGAHRSGIAESQPHEASLGLVGDARHRTT